MKDLRFKLGVATTAGYVLLRGVPAANRIIAKGDMATSQEKYDMAYEIISYMRRHFKTTTYVFGLENLPKEEGFVVYSNHQGKYDALCIFEAMKRPTSVLWEKGQASRFLSRQICDLIDAVKIDLKDPHDIVKAINQATDLVKNGRNIIIFPEGGYTDNHNHLQDFNSGCFQVSLKSKAPIVPVVLFDAYKSMNTNRLGPVKTQIHFLPPISYQEYGSLKKKELAAMIRERIEEKLAEIEQIDYATVADQAPVIMDRRRK